METRGKVVDVHFHKGQTLLPWRAKTAAGHQLRTMLIRHVLATNLHMASRKPKLWDDMVTQLLKEPEFRQHVTPETAPISGRTLQDQFKHVVEERCTFHGWTDQHGGVTANLSGHAGELDELDRNVRQIKMDLEQKQAEKEAGERIKADLEAKDAGVLSGEIRERVDAARKRRKEDPPSTGSSTGSGSAPNPFDALDDLQLWGKKFFSQSYQ